VLGTERHESRRIDNQLRGRSGRQGDPGESRFYLSLEDDLMRMFASDRVASIMQRLKWPDDEPIEAKMVSKAVENAQKQIEELNYERRKNVLKYDEVMNGQREAIYGERRKILEGQDLREEALGFIEEIVSDVVESQCPPDVFPEEWDLDGLFTALLEIYPVQVTREQAAEALDTDELVALFVEDAIARYDDRERAVTPEVMRELERVVLLNIIDTKWREHLYEMDYLQEGIHLRALAQQDPITAYRREAYDMFQALTESIRADFVRYIYRVEFVRHDEEQPRQQAAQPTRMQDNRAEVEQAGGQRASSAGRGTATANQAVSDKVPRNAPCPCGSGKKYKKCHGAAA
jgi:preprotein translocase subunit SecA